MQTKLKRPERLNIDLNIGLRTAVFLYALLLAAVPGYGQATVSDSPSVSGLSPYFGKRRVKLPPPPPVSAVVDSSLDSDGSQFLIPFQGKIDTKPTAAPTKKGNIPSWFPRVSSIVPTDIDYGQEVGETQAQNVVVQDTHRSSSVAVSSLPDSVKISAFTDGAAGSNQHKVPEAATSSWPGRVRPTKQDGHKVTYRLFGSVSRDDQFGVKIDDLLSSALARSTKVKDIDHSVAHFHSRKSKTFEGFKDSMDDATDYKGFSRSMEAVDVILDKNVKAKSKDSADYARQRYVDQLHPKIVSRVMQIAMGVGLKDKERGKQIVDEGVKALGEVVGEKQAKNTEAMLRDWSEHINIPEEIFQQQQWDVESYRDRINTATKIAMNSDPLVNDLVKRIRKYDRSSVANKAYGAANTAACLAEVVAPGLAIPFGIEVVREGMVQSNGGSEPKKLLRELYFDKRIESRYRTINEESQLAIANYQLAMANHNTVLLACAESVLSQLVGVECITDVLDTSIFHPEIKPENTQMLQADRDLSVTH